MLTGRRSGGRMLPNCSTCSSSLTMRRVSSTIRSASSRSSAERFMAISWAAPEMPASGFLISWASISAMPMADLAADLTCIARPSRSAMSRGEITSRITSALSCIGAICRLHCTGARSPLVTSTSLMNSGDWLARARASASSIGASMESRSKAGWPIRVFVEEFRKISAAGFTSAMRLSGPISSAGSGSEAQTTPGTGYGSR